MWQAVKAFIGLSEIEEENFNEGLKESRPKVPVEKSTRKNNVTFELLNNNQPTHSFRKKPVNQQFHNMAIKVAHSFEDAQELADFIRNSCPLIVNLKNLDPESTRKLTAFLSGTAYALNSTVQKLQGQMILFAPADMTISCDNSEQNIFADNQQYPQPGNGVESIDFNQYFTRENQEPETQYSKQLNNRRFSFTS